VPAVPAYNPLTADKIELGRRLFYDPRLSGNETQSCASCHLQEHAFADAKVTPSGSTGDVLSRNSMGLTNVAWLSTLTWAHDELTVFEDQVLVPITGELPVELGVNDGNAAEVLARFDADADYVSLREAAFPELDAYTLDAVAFALASFLRSLVSSDSPYDRYLAGDRDALSEDARIGLTLFNGERFECFHCHGGTHLTASYRDWDTPPGAVQSPFFNTGLYDVDGEGSYPAHDQGLFELTFDPDHRGFFRAPSLRNVALTAPYMHDGSKATLREVLEHYRAGGTLLEDGPFAGDGRTSPLKSGLVRPFEATDLEVEQVIAFLESLTDPTFVSDPRFANPFE
jgi:cytochrome c peroxidase